MKTCVLIPVHNEERTIAPLVEAIKNKGFGVYVVDDGSTDASGHLARSAGAFVIYSNLRRGKGATLRHGFDHLIDKGGYDAIITMDGDAQHLPEDLPQFVEKAKEADMIIGNRMENARGQMPFMRYWTNRFMSWVISSTCKYTIQDTQSGFRLLKTSLIQQMDLKTDSFEIESEMITKAVKLKARIVEVPIQVVYGEEESKINPFLDTIKFFKFLIRETR